MRPECLFIFQWGSFALFIKNEKHVMALFGAFRKPTRNGFCVKNLRDYIAERQLQPSDNLLFCELHTNHKCSLLLICRDI